MEQGNIDIQAIKTSKMFYLRIHLATWYIKPFTTKDGISWLCFSLCYPAKPIIKK